MGMKWDILFYVFLLVIFLLCTFLDKKKSELMFILRLLLGFMLMMSVPHSH